MATEEPADPFLAQLADWAAHSRAAEEATARRTVRQLVDQAAAESTWAGLAVDLAEAETPVVVATAGATWSGRLVGAGRDFVVITRQAAGPVLVAAEAVLTLGRTDRQAGQAGSAVRPGGQRRPPLGLDLAGALEALVAEAAPVTAWAGTHRARGRLTSVGRDYLVLIPEGGPGEVYMTLAALDAVEIL